MPRNLRLEFELSHADAELAVALVDRKSVSRKSVSGSGGRNVIVLSMRATRYALLVAIATASVLGWFMFGEISAVYRALLIGVTAAALVAFVFSWRRVRKFDPLPIVLELSDTEVATEGPNGKLVFPWSAFGECLESPDLFVLLGRLESPDRFVLLERRKRTLILAPKRAFPDESSQTWFREQAKQATDLAPPEPAEPADPIQPPSGDAVTIRFEPKYRDYLARSVTSWRVWGICLGVAIPFLILCIFKGAELDVRSVDSEFEIYLFYALPYIFTLIVVILFVLTVAGQLWGSDTLVPGAREVSLSENGVAYSRSDHNGAVLWTGLRSYKETPWLFHLFDNGTFVNLPKRAFASREDQDRCRTLLQRHLKQRRGLFA